MDVGKKKLFAILFLSSPDVCICLLILMAFTSFKNEVRKISQNVWLVMCLCVVCLVPAVVRLQVGRCLLISDSFVFELSEMLNVAGG